MAHLVEYASGAARLAFPGAFHAARPISPGTSALPKPAQVVEVSGVEAIIERALARMLGEGRRSIAIAEICCGDGAILITAASRARAMGFLAIEASGFDRSAETLDRARAVAELARDPAIGFQFEVRARGAVLPVEDDYFDLFVVRRSEAPDMARELARVTCGDGCIVRRG